MRESLLVTFLLGCLVLLGGCSAAGPNLWLLYAKGNYYYGRMEAKTEMLCAPSPRVRLQVTAEQLSDYCKESAATRDVIRAIVPTIEAELTKKEVDWTRVMQYLDLVLSLAAKAL